MAVTTQARTYTVRESLLDEWVRRWREEIVPLRLKFGFRLGGAWIDRERHHFIWEISHDGPEIFAERNHRYWDSPSAKPWPWSPRTTWSPPRPAKSPGSTDPTPR